MKDKNTLTIIIAIAAIFFISQGGLSGFAVNPYEGLKSAIPISDARFAKGNVDTDASGYIDTYDLEALRNMISLRQYSAQADMDGDGDVDWEDYGLLEDFIAVEGSGQIVPRGGTCTPGQTFCGRNVASGTGTVLRCEINRFGAPEFVQESCDKWERCRNGVCESKSAVRLR